MKSSTTGPIILVEDDPDDQEIFKDILESFKVSNEIRIFTNGLEVLDYLHTTTDQPFIIISDINFPKMNGLELREAINTNEKLRRKSIPFVFLSTNSNRSAVEKAYDLTVQGFFQKPASFDELRLTFKMIIDYWYVCKHPNS